jgi:hypothetical protein
MNRTLKVTEILDGEEFDSKTVSITPKNNRGHRKGKKKTGGRKAGVPNKKTALIKAFCHYLVEDGFDKFKDEINKLEGKEYVEVFIGLAKISCGSPKNQLAANESLLEFFNTKIKDQL